MQRATLLLSLIIGFAAQSARCQSNVWEKTIGGNRRLVVSRVALSDGAFSEKLAQFKLSHQTLDDFLPTECYTYRLNLYEKGRDRVKCLWQTDRFQYERTSMANYSGPLELQILDACYTESNNTIVLLMKALRETFVVISPSTPGRPEIKSKGEENTVIYDEPSGAWFTKAGTIDCSSQKGWLVRLVNQTNHLAVFAWKDGKWLRQPESEP
jgi:hypothetical protein